MRRSNRRVSDESIVWAGPRTKRNRQSSLQTVRLIVQIAFALLCLWIGLEFHHFVAFIESGGQVPPVTRPPGVDGFLPISSLMSLYYFFLTGVIHPFHPAGLFILTAIIVMSLLFGKSFCSWLCPVGLVSELLGDLSRKLLGRNLSPPSLARLSPSQPQIPPARLLCLCDLLRNEHRRPARLPRQPL